MYIQAEAEKYLSASQDIIDRLHRENSRENFILNTKFKLCYFPAHAENLSLKFAFTGNEFYEYGRKKVAVSQNNFLVINEGQEHASWIESDHWVNSFAIYFTPTFAASVISELQVKDEKLLDEPFELVGKFGNLNFFQTLFPFSQGFVAEVSQFKTYLERTGGKERLLVDERLRKLFFDFIYIHQSELSIQLKKIDVVKASTKLEIIKRVHVARDFIESFYTRRITIQDISAACFLSQNLLMRYFKAVFNISLHQYIINKRLEFAFHKILTTNLTFNEITLISGFECASSFGRLFKERFGVTPNSFRGLKQESGLDSC